MKNFTDWGIRIRRNPELNYYSIWHNLKTVRLDLGPTMELKPERSEFYDVGLGTKCNLSCPFCFLPGTKILIEGSTGERFNTINIEDCSVGNMVCSMSPDHCVQLKPISQLHEREYEGDLILVEVEDSHGKVFSITCTPNHRIFTMSPEGLPDSYIEAEKLSCDSKLLLFDAAEILYWAGYVNSPKCVVKTIKRILGYKGKVYNIGVEDNNNYFANGILVHNCYVSAGKGGEFWPKVSKTWKSWLDSFPEDIAVDPKTTNDETVKELLSIPEKGDSADVINLKLIAKMMELAGKPIVYTEKPFQIAIGI